jgi:hypothetical protein
MKRLGVVIVCCLAFASLGLFLPVFSEHSAGAEGDAAAIVSKTSTPTRTKTQTRTKTTTRTPTVTVTSTPTAQASPIVVDNTSSGFSTTGSWTVSTQNPGYYGTNYLSDGGTGKGTKTAKWTSPVVTTGDYELSMFFPVSDASRSTSVPVTVLLANGTTTTITVNEQAAGGTWISLGTYYFTPMAGQYVQISNAGTTGVVVADAFSWTFVPLGGLPTATPLPVTTPIPGLLAKLPVVYSIVDTTVATYFDQTASANDVALVVNDVNAATVLATLTTGIPYWGDPSWADAQPQLSGLVRQSHIKGFAYDAEHWTFTPQSEQNDIANTVKTLGTVVHGLGLQVWVSPDDGFAQAAIEPIAENADVIILQEARNVPSPTKYEAIMLPLIAQAKAANPAVKIYAKVDFTNGTPQQDLAALQAIETKIDGISLSVSDGDLTNLDIFRALLAQN